MDTRQRGVYSPALLAAQQRLQTLRRQHQDSCRVDMGLPVVATADGLQLTADNHPDPRPPIPDPQSPQEVVKVYPDIALAMLKEGLAAAGRLWHLLRYVDTTGSGRIDVQAARDRLTRKDDPLRICGWRQLRKLLKQGEGIFWDRCRERLWLRAPAKVAAALNVSRLTGRPVALPVHALLQGIGVVRAHFYASFHSGRMQPAAGSPRAKPIARATLRQLSHLSRRTQRYYEERAGVNRQFNYAIGKQNTLMERQKRAWKHGRAFFRFTDHKGRVGKKGVTYTAWQLPNAYYGPHDQQPVGQQKRINRELADLFMKGMTGNGKASDNGFTNDSRQDLKQGHVATGPKRARRFHNSGASAVRTYSSHPDRDAYWRTSHRDKDHCPNGPRHDGRYRLWHLLPAQE